MSINLSGTSLNDDRFLEFLINELAQETPSPGAMCFEITETAAMSNLANVVYFMRELKNRGCRFSLDDFGSGLSSFMYLKTLPVDYLKIDGQFIENVTRDPIDRSMVEAISQIGRAMGIQTDRRAGRVTRGARRARAARRKLRTGFSHRRARAHLPLPLRPGSDCRPAPPGLSIRATHVESRSMKSALESASEHDDSSLIGPEDPPPFTLLNIAGKGALLLVCDHASRAFPNALEHLGLGSADTARHIAWDIGAASLTRVLGRLFDAPAVLAGYSRLLIDCNRAPEDPTSIVTRAMACLFPATTR